MLPGLVENFDGLFWIEKNDDTYELHVEFKVNTMSLETKERLIAVSTSGKNEEAKGIMGKVRSITETLILTLFEPNMNVASSSSYFNMGMMYEDPYSMADSSYLYAWSLYNYKKSIINESQQESMDELEYSIVANIADDILVGIKGKNVEIVVKKNIKN